ncbi:MAG: arsenosugar biosynthesis radical SAM (seleno)protein ArsS [Betaproteobacteria bacterium]
MHDTLPLLRASDFPALRRQTLQTLQVNLGYLCNQSCVHCHVNAGPQRKEQMDGATADLVIEALQTSGARSLDLTGGAPELNQHFRRLVRAARAQGVRVIDRCNLSVLFEPGQETLAEFLAEQGVEVVASLPCYSQDNVDQQRGEGVFEKSVRALQALNALGYGQSGSELLLSLVYNPQKAVLPPPQLALQADYERLLWANFGVRFNHLFTLANMPIQRFGSMLVSKGQFHAYMALLKDSHRQENLAGLMCLSTVSVDWQGYLYDCDFNQMLGLPAGGEPGQRPHLSDLLRTSAQGRPIVVADHCYGCTAGQGSSCGGALSRS